MKKNLMYYLMAVVCTLCLCTACDDDDDDNNNLTVDQVTGNFTGTLTVMGQAVSNNTTVTVTKVDDTHVTVGLASITVGAMTVTNISVPCTLTRDDDDFNLVGSGTTEVTGMGTLPVTVTGDVDSRELDIDITVTDVPQLGTIPVDFDGYK